MSLQSFRRKAVLALRATLASQPSSTLPRYLEGNDMLRIWKLPDHRISTDNPIATSTKLIQRNSSSIMVCSFVRVADNQCSNVA